MRTHLAAILSILLAGRPVVSQNATASLTLYYGINETRSYANTARLDSFYQTLKERSFNLYITGYADYLAGDAHNDRLSQERADAVKAYFTRISSRPQMTILKCTGVGEKFSKGSGATGEPSQRKVEIVAEITEPVKVIDTRPQQITEPPMEEQVVQQKDDGVSAMENAEEGDVLNIRGIQFIGGRHVLMKHSVPVLRRLLKVLKENPTMKIEIQGHICCLDGKEDGLDFDTGEKKLSMNRARAVYEYLVQNGIDPDRMKYRGFGHKRPLVFPELSPADEQMNRRVDIKIISK